MPHFFFLSLTSEEPADSIGSVAALCGNGLAVRAALVQFLKKTIC